MPAASPRSRTLLVLASGLALVLLALAARRDVERAAAAPERVRQDDVAASSPAAPRAPAPARAALPAHPAAAAEVAGEAVEPVDAVDPLAALLARLEALARAPQSFHRRALEPLEALRALEREQPEAQRAAWTAGVVEGVVRDAARPELVRGAVLVGLARGVPAAMRDALLDAELRRVGGSGELLRATALAAALAGEESYCAEALDLGRFLALRTPGDERPRTFPLRLERLVPPHVSARLGAWLADAAARLDELAEVQDEAAARELFASAELLFLLRGHRALLDAEVEGEVLRAAEPAPDERAPSRLYALRAASFLVHALAPCNDACFDAAARLGASDDPLLRALTDEVAGAAAPGLSVALQARLEALRYANERDGVGELMSALLALGADIEARAPAVDAQAVAYVAELALDSSVDPLARVTALRALQRAGDWTALRDAGARVLETESSQPLLVTALGSLAAGAGDDPARRAELRELLERRRAATSLAWLERALEQQLAALAD